MANPKADKARIIFGIGLGVALTVVVVFIAYIVQRNAHFTAFEEENYYLYGLLREARANGYVSDEIVIDRARDLGMIFPNEAGTPDVYEDFDDAPSDEETYDDAPLEADDDEEPAEADEVAGEYVWVSIPWGAHGNYIAVILQHHGVIDSADEFESFLITGGHSVSLMAGDFLLPIGGDFEEIVQMISVGN
ncbi:MAG: hypothetical protein FWB98_03740 [Defluviitaleaceae bacterium]|nr:hypothetical protein [Defluviitaleaceae bacterium]